MALFLFQSADDVVREIGRLQRNYEFLTYQVDWDAMKLWLSNN